MGGASGNRPRLTCAPCRRLTLKQRYPDVEEIEWEHNGNEWRWNRYIAIPSQWVQGQMTSCIAAGFMCYEITVDGALLDLTVDLTVDTAS
jgi:hypothetical protein